MISLGSPVTCFADSADEIANAPNGDSGRAIQLRLSSAKWPKVQPHTMKG